jgi:hypothetical protein
MVYSFVIPKAIVCCLSAFNSAASFVISQYLKSFYRLSFVQNAGGLKKLTQTKANRDENTRRKESHFCILWQGNKNDQDS